MKKDVKIIIALFLLLIIGSTILKIVIPIQKKAAEEKRELAKLYYEQNKAFELAGEYTNKDQYHGAKDLKLNVLAYDLYAFNVSQNEYKLSIDEILEYISEECDSDGKPRIYSRSDSINYYILWYIPYRDDFVMEYSYAFNNYLKAHGYKCDSYRDMNYEEVVDALEEYQNDPSYVPPGQQKD